MPREKPIKKPADALAEYNIHAGAVRVALDDIDELGASADRIEKLRQSMWLLRGAMTEVTRATERKPRLAVQPTGRALEVEISA